MEILSDNILKYVEEINYRCPFLNLIWKIPQNKPKYWKFTLSKSWYISSILCGNFHIISFFCVEILWIYKVCFIDWIFQINFCILGIVPYKLLFMKIYFFFPTKFVSSFSASYNNSHSNYWLSYFLYVVGNHTILRKYYPPKSVCGKMCA